MSMFVYEDNMKKRDRYLRPPEGEKGEQVPPSPGKDCEEM